jgi:ferredoxin-type protein NapH
MIMECPNCRRSNRPTARFCSYCGAPLSEVRAPSPSSAAPGVTLRERFRLTRLALPSWLVAPLLLVLAFVVIVILVLRTAAPGGSDYERIINTLQAAKGLATFSSILWIGVLVALAFWLRAGLTLSKVRLVVQLSFFGLLNTFFYFGQPLITPIILPILQCNHLNTNTANCLFGPFMRDLALHMPVPLYVPLAALGSFMLAAVLLGRAWCGWVCPVGLLSDVLTYVRQGLLKAERWAVSQAVHDRLIYIKYGILATFFLLSASIGLTQLVDPIVGRAYINALPEALRYEPDCMFCPAPALFAYWPLVLLPTLWTFSVNAEWLSRLGTLIATSWTYFVVSILFVVFSLFIPRVFCRYFCWVRAMTNLVAKYSPIGIHKDVKACKSCRTCQRVCPMMVKQILEEKENPRIAEPECDSCLLCVENCPDRNLRLLVGKWRFLPLFPGQKKG